MASWWPRSDAVSGSHPVAPSSSSMELTRTMCLRGGDAFGQDAVVQSLRYSRAVHLIRDAGRPFGPLAGKVVPITGRFRVRGRT
jgi:hypothetical protein